jgi:hypothetical protein
MAGIIVVLLLAQIGGAAPHVSPLERLQAKVRVDSVQNFTTAHLAGKYSDPAKEFQPVLSGNDLYPFADGAYPFYYHGELDSHPNNASTSQPAQCSTEPIESEYAGSTSRSKLSIQSQA